MLKHNLKICAAVCIAAAGLLFSCKSAPVESPVDPVELLDDDGAIYLTVPVSPNIDFVNAAIKKVAKCDDSDAKKLSERINNLYICIGTNGKTQISADGEFPSTMIRFALTEKKGWTRTEKLSYSIYSNNVSPFGISLPSSKNACISQNVDLMLERYDAISKDDLHTVQMNERVYNFLKSNNTPDIEVLATVPQAFIRTFIGANVNAPVETIKGTFKNLKDGKQFGLKIVLDMEDPRTVKAACAALKIALFPIPAKIVQTGSKQITVTDITLDYNDLLKFLK